MRQVPNELHVLTDLTTGMCRSGTGPQQSAADKIVVSRVDSAEKPTVYPSRACLRASPELDEGTNGRAVQNHWRFSLHAEPSRSIPRVFQQNPEFYLILPH